MNYQTIQAGITGAQFIDIFNGNLSLTEQQLESLAANLLLRVIANNVKQLKVEDGKLYYTLDDTNWVSVDNNVWGSIAGNILDQTDLVQLLEYYATVNQLDTVAGNVSTLANTVSGLGTTVSNLSSNVSQNTTAIGNLQGDISDKVSSDTIKRFRISASGFLEYSLDGVAWQVVQSLADINWGSIGGEIANQVDLKTILDSKVNTSTLTSHTGDTNNPHEVTKAQVGLGNVDNTSDEDKPISLAERAALDSITVILEGLSEDKMDVTEDVKSIEYITLADWNAKKQAGELSNTTIYIVD